MLQLSCIWLSLATNLSLTQQQGTPKWHLHASGPDPPGGDVHGVGVDGAGHIVGVYGTPFEVDWHPILVPLDGGQGHALEHAGEVHTLTPNCRVARG